MKSLRNTLRETIFMRVCICFCIGIICYQKLSPYMSIMFISFAVFLLICLLFYYATRINSYNYTFKKENGMVVYIVVIIFAIVLSFLQDQRNNAQYLSCVQQKQFRIIIKNEGKTKKNKVIHEVKVLHNNREINSALISIKNKKTPYQLGDTLSIKGELLPLETKKHPAEFDYKNYLTYKRIYHQFIIDSADVIACKKQQKVTFWTIIAQSRNKLIETLERTIRDKESYEMAAALLLGERADIDQETMKNYSDTGTIHIISVSGLHVGIIYLVFSYALHLLKIFKNIYVKTFVIIVFIWLYACITGLPASVIRSALMISFLCLGKAINSKANTMNHIAASAFLILCIDTNYLFDIGFQLSYLAVIGIVYLQQPIYNLYQPKYKVDKYVWLTFSVSIAAQLFTLPLCMYYFHQFPNYFLLANLLAIPLSSIALYAGIACLLFSKISYLNALCEWIVSTSINILNNFLEFIANLPGAVYHSNPWTILDALFCAISIALLLLWTIEKRRMAVIVFLSLGLLYGCIGMVLEHRHQHLWVYYRNKVALYSLEMNDSVVHFIPSHMKEYELNRFKQNNQQLYTKKQVYQSVHADHYYLKVKNEIFNDTLWQKSFHAAHYERICL